MKKITLFIIFLFAYTQIQAQCDGLQPVLTVSGAALCEGESNVVFVLSPNLTSGCQIATDSGIPYVLQTPSGDEMISTTNEFELTSLESGTYTAFYTYESVTTGSCECAIPDTPTLSTSSNIIEILPIPDTPNAIEPDSICSGESILLEAISNGNQLIWKDEIGEVVFVGEDFQTPPIYEDVVYQVFALNGECESEVGDEINIIVNELDVPIIIGKDTICEGANAVLEVTNVLANEQIHWYADALTINLLHVGSLFTTPALSDYTVYYVKKVRQGCESDITEVYVVVEELEPPIVTNLNVNICEGEATILTANGSGILHWYANGALLGVGNTIEYMPTESGSTVTVEAHFGNCVSEPTIVNVLVDELPPMPKIDGQSVICEGETLTITYDNPNSTYQHFWNTPNVDSESGTSLTISPIDGTYTGIYQLTVTDMNGCENSSQEIFIEVLPLPSVGLQDTIFVYEGEQIQLQASGGISYEWMPEDYLSNSGIANPVFTPPYLAFPEAEFYQYNLAVNDGACESTATTNIIVRPKEEIIVYDVITPNGDGHNDEWFISFPSNQETYRIHVFDRHNQLIFQYEGNDYNNNRWNGRARGGKIVPNAAYFYKIELEDPNANCPSCSGMITVLSKSNN